MRQSKSCNLIGWEYFGLHLRNKIFPKYRICAGTQQIIKIFIIEQIQWKLWPIFSLNLTYFFLISPIFGAKTFFQKIGLLCTTSYEFLAPWENSEKSQDQIPRKNPDRCQEGRIDRPYFIGSFQLPLGS